MTSASKPIIFFLFLLEFSAALVLSRFPWRAYLSPIRDDSLVMAGLAFFVVALAYLRASGGSPRAFRVLGAWRYAFILYLAR